jgi:hypothetical protein
LTDSDGPAVLLVAGAGSKPSTPIAGDHLRRSSVHSASSNGILSRAIPIRQTLIQRIALPCTREPCHAGQRRRMRRVKETGQFSGGTEKKALIRAALFDAIRAPALVPWLASRRPIRLSSGHHAALRIRCIAAEPASLQFSRLQISFCLCAFPHATCRLPTVLGFDLPFLSCVVRQGVSMMAP